MPGYRGSGSTQPSSHHRIVCLNAVWHGPLFCPSVVKSQWTEGAWGDWAEKRMEVREKKIKKSGEWKGEDGGRENAEKKKERNKMGMRAERWKKTFKEEGQGKTVCKWKRAITCRFYDTTWILHQLLPLPGPCKAFSSIWNEAMGSLWYHWRERRPGPVTPVPSSKG